MGGGGGGGGKGAPEDDVPENGLDTLPTGCSRSNESLEDIQLEWGQLEVMVKRTSL